MKGWERTCFLELWEDGGLGRWNWFMYAEILARSVEEATWSLRREFWRKGNWLEGGGGLYNLRFSRPLWRSSMAVAESARKAAGEMENDQRQENCAI